MEETLTILDRHIDERFSTDLTERYDLILQVSLHSVSYSLYDSEKDYFIGVESFRDPLSRVLEHYSWMKQPFHSVTVILENGRSSLIPSLLYESGHKEDLLDFSVGREPGETVLSDLISHLEIRNLFPVDGNLLELIRSVFPSAQVCHITSALICGIGLHYSDRTGNRQIFIHVREEAADIIVYDKRQLIYCNSFSIRAPEDLVYYVMFVMEQLGLNPEETEAILMGSIEKKSSAAELLYRYIHRVDFAKHSGEFVYSYTLEEIPGHYYFPLLNPGPCGS